MNVIRLGGAEIELHDDGLTITRYGKRFVEARPHLVGDVHGTAEAAAYAQQAAEAGYGSDVHRFSREHELGHSLLAHWLGLPASPTLLEFAHGRGFRHAGLEEAAVLALQAYAIAARVDLTAISTQRKIEK